VLRQNLGGGWSAVGGVAGRAFRRAKRVPLMKYSKREVALEGMPKKTAYQSAFSAQRRAIARMARKTAESRMVPPERAEQTYTEPISPDAT
jgi:hypothetical protein